MRCPGCWPSSPNGSSSRRRSASCFEPSDGGAAIVAKDAEPSVTVRGDVGELVLFAFGRQAHSTVTPFGDDASIEAVMTASFGL